MSGDDAVSASNIIYEHSGISVDAIPTMRQGQPGNGAVRPLLIPLRNCKDAFSVRTMKLITTDLHIVVNVLIT